MVVTFSDQTKYDAEVLAKDPGNDLGLLRITPRKKLPFLRLGESDNLQVGQKVLAIGNPFGLDGTLTTGIISSLNRNIRDENNRELEGMVREKFGAVQNTGAVVAEFSVRAWACNWGAGACSRVAVLVS